MPVTEFNFRLFGNFPLILLVSLVELVSFYQILNNVKTVFSSHNIFSICYLTLELTTYFSKQYLAKIDINESTRLTS